MDASDIFAVLNALVFILLPPFLFGLAGGLWCKHVRSSVLIGLVVGLFATVMPVILSSRDPMVQWGDVAVRLFFFLVVPAALGSLVGHGARSYSLQSYPVGFTLLFGVLGAFGYALVLPLWSPARAIARQTMCTSNLQQIGVALAKYANEHEGHLPPEDGANGLDHLLREGFLDRTNDSTVFLCPWDEVRHAARPGEPLTEDTVSCVYKGSRWEAGNPANAVPVCWDKIENHHGIGVNVLFNDGHVEWVPLKRWKKIKPGG